jgi:hypothetical protein
VVDSRIEYKIVVEELSDRRSLGRPRRRWDDNIKINLMKVWCEGVV